MRHSSASGSADRVFLLPGEASQKHRLSNSGQGSITPLWAPRGLSHPIISRSHPPPQAGNATTRNHRYSLAFTLTPRFPVLSPASGTFSSPALLCSWHHCSKPAPNMLEIPPLHFSPEQSCKLPLNSCQHLETQRPHHRAVLR